MLFGTSGIRGRFSELITTELAFKCGYVFGEDKLAIAGDLRETTPILMKAVCLGAQESGKDVIDLGFIPTPTLAYFTQKTHIPGIMITASHNPKEYNGFKFYRDGNEISKNEEQKIEEKIKNFKKNKIKLGKITRLDFRDEHIKLIKRQVKIKENIKIVVDCNGVTQNLVPRLLKELGCEVISINCGGKGFYRESEPCEKNLSLLKKCVKNTNALLGIAHDGDGDRLAVIDKHGNFVSKDELLAIFVNNEVKNLYVGTVEESSMIKEIVKEKNAKRIIVPVGSRNVSEMMRKTNADFGGEPAGEFIFKHGVWTGDGPMAAAKIIEIASKMDINEFISNLPKYFIERYKFKVHDKIKTMENIKNKVKGNTIDGIRIEEDDGFILIRASGTENVIRLTVESKNKEKLREKIEIYKKIIKESIV